MLFSIIDTIFLLKFSKGHNFIKNVGSASVHQISVSAFGESLGNSSDISACVCVILMSFHLILRPAFVELSIYLSVFNVTRHQRHIEATPVGPV